MDPSIGQLLGGVNDLLKLSPGAIFALMWYLTWREKQKLQSELSKSMESMLRMNDAWLKVIGRGNGGGVPGGK